MSLNEILRNEQITLMRFAEANNARDAGKLRRKLDMFDKILAAHPYAHRAYVTQGPGIALSAPESFERSAFISSKRLASVEWVAKNAASDSKGKL